MRSAIIEDSFVTNIIVGEIPGAVACPDDVALGWSYTDGQFSPPPPETPPVPEWVWMFQLRKALRRMLLDEDRPELGDALSTLEAYAATAGDDDLTDELSAATVRRDHGTVAQLAFLFQWADARLDDAFRLAATL